MGEIVTDKTTGSWGVRPTTEDIDPEALLVEAHAYAQRRFREMLEAKSYSDPDAAETRAYLLAERIVDELLTAVQWEKAKAELDRLQAADLEELAQGDHFAGMPRTPMYEGMD